MEIINQLVANGLVIGLTYTLFALGVTLIFGILGMINFAHGEFYMLGAFGSYILQQELGLNYFQSGIVTIVIICLIAWLIEKFTLRSLLATDHLNSLLATFGLSIVLLNLVAIAYGTTPRQISSPFNGVVHIGNVFITQQKIVVVLLGIVVIVLLNLFIKHSHLGKLMRAVSQNSMGAMVSGISIKRIYSFTFIFGVSLATLAGILIGPTTYVTPTMGTSVMLKGFVIVILGGLGSVPGAIIGGMLLGFVETGASSLVGNSWKDIIGYVILILVLLVRPQGIFGFQRRSQ
ncbi:branched-chain amino acid ABC transporter permease [Neobacillus drentensis]|uniref:branched-chain amino acid ABC transporter permease n=1 Tax=Neobacillus drentensis TaxID=220684 RepID=UPI0008256F2B|nr:branched-chain amino acid ABC transporter permease [Neobacillus drentensis]